MLEPLKGLRVVEVGNFIAVPYGGMILADLGAEVTKVESPRGGDLVRSSGPFADDESSIFLQLNRNKRSIAVDLRAEGGPAVVRRLLSGCDVFMENLRPGAISRLGLGYPDLAADHPGLIYLSASGYGQTGRYASRPGLDVIAQGLSGLMSITGPEDGEPAKVGVPIADLSCAMYAVIALLAAVHERSQTGRGRYIDVSLLESAVSLAVWEAARYFTTGEVPRPSGSAHQAAAPYQAVRVADGYVTVGAATSATWLGLCSALDLEHLVDHPDFLTNDLRYHNRHVLSRIIEERLSQMPAAECLERLRAHGVPCGPIHDYEQVFHDEHLAEAGMFPMADHPTVGKVTHVGSPMRFDGERATIRRTAPRLGEHSVELLSEAGFSPREVSDLLADEIVSTPPT